MSFRKCEECGFNIINSARGCPNCGRNYPLPGIIPKFLISTPLYVIGASGLFLTGLLTIGLLLFSPRDLALIAPYLAVSTILFGFNRIANFIVYSRKSENLKQYKRQIDTRIKEINKRMNQIIELWIRIENTEHTESIEKTRKIVEHGQAILEKYRIRYDIEKRRIDYIYWKNRYEPYIGIRLAPESGKDKSIKDIDSMQGLLDEGKKMYEETDSVPEYKQEGSGIALLAEFKSSLGTCRIILESLINQQAFLVMRDVSPLNAQSESVNVKVRLFEGNESLNDSLSAVSDLKAGLDKLEDEYFRIKAEEELS